MSGSLPNSVSQNSEENHTYGKRCVDYGTSHQQYHAQRAQQISDAVDTLGDVHHVYKQTWHTVTKPAYLDAHNTHGQAWIDHGTKAHGDGVAFPDSDQASATKIASISAEGSAGIPTTDGIPT